MSEKPLERLNYYNGQRLEAKDLKLEQEYHIRVRRWLNKSLYSSGIAQGLTVRFEKDKDEKVLIVVGPGLAIDNEGREIILLEEKRPDLPGETETYLTIEYNERKTEEETGSCTNRKTGGHVAWGGPARILAEPLLKFHPQLPPGGSGKIVLAKVRLINNCTDVEFDMSLRKYIGAASASKVNQYVLEGERHIDKDNPGKIFFHIRGRQPNAVTLYLRAESFSTLYYSELGQHQHDVGGTIPAHAHTITGVLTKDNVPHTGQGTAHKHSYVSSTARVVGYRKPSSAGFYHQDFNAVQLVWDANSQSVNILTNVDMFSESEHTHPTPTVTDPYPASGSVSVTTTPQATGAIDSPARVANKDGTPAKKLTYVSDLQVSIGKVSSLRGISGKNYTNYTKEILAQLANANSEWNNKKLGDGSDSHQLVKTGTGPIKLDFLPDLSFDEDDGGEYVIELSVDKDNDCGGRILYNLYVE